MSVGAAIAGVAMALPERLVSNEQIAAGLDVDPAWIAKRTGTHERPWAHADQRLSHLAADASRAALEHTGVEPRELDLVLVATSTADEITPNAAPLVAGLIGAERAGALDAVRRWGRRGRDLRDAGVDGPDRADRAQGRPLGRRPDQARPRGSDPDERTRHIPRRRRSARPGQRRRARGRRVRP